MITVIILPNILFREIQLSSKSIKIKYIYSHFLCKNPIFSCFFFLRLIIHIFLFFYHFILLGEKCTPNKTQCFLLIILNADLLRKVYEFSISFHSGTYSGSLWVFIEGMYRNNGTIAFFLWGGHALIIISMTNG